MQIDYHSHVLYDIAQISDKTLKKHLKNILKSSFYNIGVPYTKYPNVWIFDGQLFDILYIKNKNSILVVSIHVK